MVRAFLILLLPALPGVAADLLGTPLRQDGYTFSPPTEFRMARLEPFAGTRVGAVGEAPDAARSLSAALVDGPGSQAAALLVAVVDGPFEAGPATRDDFAAAVARHFREELGLEYALESVEQVAGAAPRIEIRGTVRQQGQLRYLLVAGMEGQARHTVITFSVPSGRWSALQPALRASLDSFRADPAPGPGSRGLAGFAAGALLAALVLSRILRRHPRSADGP